MRRMFGCWGGPPAGRCPDVIGDPGITTFIRACDIRGCCPWLLTMLDIPWKHIIMFCCNFVSRRDTDLGETVKGKLSHAVSRNDNKGGVLIKWSTATGLFMSLRYKFKYLFISVFKYTIQLLLDFERPILNGLLHTCFPFNRPKF